jgi:hypothetical protein
MKTWVESKAVGWEAYALGHALVAVHDEPESFRRTLLLESALTHQRCLIEFLAGRLQRSGKRTWSRRYDITPTDMLPGWDPTTQLASSSLDLLTAELARIDAHLAHISRKRVRIAREEWDLAPVTRAVLDGLDGFVASLRRAGSFHGNCLAAWVNSSRALLAEAGIDLEQPQLVLPSSHVMFMVPVGESSGRAAALMAQADDLLG